MVRPCRPRHLPLRQACGPVTEQAPAPREIAMAQRDPNPHDPRGLPKEGRGDRRAEMEWRHQRHGLPPGDGGIPWTNPSLLNTHPHLHTALSGLVSAQPPFDAGPATVPGALGDDHSGGPAIDWSAFDGLMGQFSTELGLVQERLRAMPAQDPNDRRLLALCMAQVQSLERLGLQAQQVSRIHQRGAAGLHPEKLSVGRALWEAVQSWSPHWRQGGMQLRLPADLQRQPWLVWADAGWLSLWLDLMFHWATLHVQQLQLEVDAQPGGHVCDLRLSWTSPRSPFDHQHWHWQSLHSLARLAGMPLSGSDPEGAAGLVLRLPALSEDNPFDAAVKAMADAPVGPRVHTLLLVEEDQMVRTALESLVRRAGLACMSTGSWQQAHDWSLQHGFDGVLVGPLTLGSQHHRWESWLSAWRSTQPYAMVLECAPGEAMLEEAPGQRWRLGRNRPDEQVVSDLRKAFRSGA